MAAFNQNSSKNRRQKGPLAALPPSHPNDESRTTRRLAPISTSCQTLDQWRCHLGVSETGHVYVYIRRPLPSFGLGGAAPGITVGVQHGPVPALSFSMAPSKLQKLQNRSRPRKNMFTAIRCFHGHSHCRLQFHVFHGFHGHSTFFHGQMHTFSRPNLVFTAIS